MRFRAISATLVAIVAPVFFLGCSGSQEETAGVTEADLSVPVEVVRLDGRPFTVYGEYYGEVSGLEEVELITVSGGRVSEINVSVGDAVEAGDSLARIEAEKAVRQYETAIYNERLARESFERQKRFLDEGNSYQLAVDQAELALLQSRTALLDAEKVRDGALAITPISGIVVARYIDLYEEVPPGEATFVVSNLSRMKVRLGVPEADIAGVRTIGGSAEVTLGSLPGRVWEGEVVSFSRRRSERNLTFQVELHIDNQDQAILSGTTAKVRLPLRTIDEAVVVPSSTIVTRGENSYLVVAEGAVAHLRQVVLGPSNERETVILDGVSPGEEIVVRGINQVDEGSVIRIIDRQDV
ncbi:MAG: efflux RND transporter periplasmic adaptor subunit [Spirochaetaceae bacterium]